MKFRLALLAFSMLTPAAANANYCAAPLSRTNETISGVVNTYYPITRDIADGSKSVWIGNPRGASSDLRVGDLILFWTPLRAQAALSGAQDDTYGSGDNGGGGHGIIDANDTGKFVWMRVAGTGGNIGTPGSVVRSAATTGEVEVTLTNGAGLGAFTSLVFQGANANVAASGQVIRVPQYGNATISGTVTAVPYRQTVTTGTAGPKSTGGIVALDVAGTLTFGPGAKIDVDAIGFRGGAAQRFDGKATGTSQTAYYFSPYANNPSGSTGWGGIKGEGIAGTPRRVIDQGQLTSGLDYTGTGAISVDGYGTTTTPGAWGKGGPGNAGGGSSDQCPQGVNGTHTAGVSVGLSNTMCRVVSSASGAYVTYAFNRLNTGGGGGAGYGDGGTGGGHDYDGVSAGVSGPMGGGIGGKGIDSFTAKFPDQPIPGGFHQIAIMGGGGGAGSTNAATSPTGDASVGELQSSGAAGGGVVLVRAGRLAGSGTVSANGGDARNVTATDTEYPSNVITGGTDQGNAGGGGGGGGWILLSARQASTPSLTLQARGGKGGNSNLGQGAGGGGGGGYIGVSTTIAGTSASVTGGARGEIGLVNGGTTLPKATSMAQASTATSVATAGASGSTGTFAASSLSVPASNSANAAIRGATSSSVAPGPQCVPYVTKEFSDDNGATWKSSITMAQGATFKMRLRIENANEDAFQSGSTLPQAFQNLAFTDTYPANIRNAAVPNVTHSNCSSPTITAAANGGSLSVGGGAGIDGQQTCTITVDLKATAGGTSTNTIPAGGVTVVQLKGIPGESELTLPSYEDVSASVTVPAGMGASKSSVVVSDPVNNTSSPKRIPGALIDYTVAVTNPTAVVLDNNTTIITDTLPATVNLFVGNLATGAPAATGAPYAFTANGSTLTCSYTALASTTDCVDFSTDGVNWTYVPTPNGTDGTDSAVRYIRFSTAGSMAGNTDFSVRYRVKLK